MFAVWRNKMENEVENEGKKIILPHDTICFTKPNS